MIGNTRTALSALALAAVLLLPGTALAEEAADRAAVAAEEITLTGGVVAIGRESRMLIVEGPKGRQVALKAPKEGQGFDQISMGDTVTARYVESGVLAITPVVLEVHEGVALARVKVGEEVSVTLTEGPATTIAPSE